MSDGELKKRIIEGMNHFLEHIKYYENKVNVALKPELDEAHAKIKLQPSLTDGMLPVNKYFKIIDEAKKELLAVFDWYINEKSTYEQYLIRIEAWTEKWFGEIPEYDTVDNKWLGDTK